MVHMEAAVAEPHQTAQTSLAAFSCVCTISQWCRFPILDVGGPWKGGPFPGLWRLLWPKSSPSFNQRGPVGAWAVLIPCYRWEYAGTAMLHPGCRCGSFQGFHAPTDHTEMTRAVPCMSLVRMEWSEHNFGHSHQRLKRASKPSQKPRFPPRAVCAVSGDLHNCCKLVTLLAP